MEKKQQVIILVGPTASGKTDTAIELAKRINAEIISADSMQVYKHMDIISAKPDDRQRKQVVHHLIDILEPKESYNAAIFREKALELIGQISVRGKVPLIVGGTGLYIKALTAGIFQDRARDELFRKQLEDEARENGNEFLYQRLSQVDPEAASKIHANDLRRIIRALEVYELTDKTITELRKNTEPLDSKYEYKIFAIERDRDKLYSRIEQRVDNMFAAGMLDEVKCLLESDLSATALQALGIKQIRAYLSGECTLEKAVELIKRDSRRFAKRQLTWFRAQKDIIWLPADEQTDSLELAEKIISLLSL